MTVHLTLCFHSDSSTTGQEVQAHCMNISFIPEASKQLCHVLVGVTKFRIIKVLYRKAMNLLKRIEIGLFAELNRISLFMCAVLCHRTGPI